MEPAVGIEPTTHQVQGGITNSQRISEHIATQAFYKNIL